LYHHTDTVHRVQTGLAGKVVIVTTATANIGRGIALAFADDGARVVITGRPRRVWTERSVYEYE
jgi:NAD(P)-dependent dehydrogenase (short-subunit alcohol dehydrogenase family)